MAHPPSVNITSATPPASNEERRALPLHAIPGKNLPDPPTRTSQSSMESSEGVSGQHMTTRELQEILMKTNVYDENDPIVKRLQEKRKSSSKK